MLQLRQKKKQSSSLVTSSLTNFDIFFLLSRVSRVVGPLLCSLPFSSAHRFSVGFGFETNLEEGWFCLCWVIYVLIRAYGFTLIFCSLPVESIRFLLTFFIIRNSHLKCFGRRAQDIPFCFNIYSILVSFSQFSNFRSLSYLSFEVQIKTCMFL